MIDTRAPRSDTRTPKASAPGRRVGYAVAAVLNGVLLYVVNNLPAWDLFPFLTDDFSRVLWILDLSLLASLLVNVAWIWFDPIWFKGTTQIALNAISLAVTVRMWNVFPFDFSAYSFDWETVARVVLVIGGVGLSIGILVELVNVGRWAISSAADGASGR